MHSRCLLDCGSMTVAPKRGTIRGAASSTPCPRTLCICGSSKAGEEWDEAEGTEGLDRGTLGPAGMWFFTASASVLMTVFASRWWRRMR